MIPHKRPQAKDFGACRTLPSHLSLSVVDTRDGYVYAVDMETNHAARAGVDLGYSVVDPKKYYRAGAYRHFTEDARCSVSMTARIDVTSLEACSAKTGTSFYMNFVYLLARVLNSRADYRMGYLWESGQLVCWDRINPTHYHFFEDSETCTPIYTEYDPSYLRFYENMRQDIEAAKERGTYGLDMAGHPNWFDASYIPWISYDSLNVELPDGHLFFNPIVNWGRWREERGALVMPLTIRLNHAVADGYLVALAFRLLEQEMSKFALGPWPPFSGDGTAAQEGGPHG